MLRRDLGLYSITVVANFLDLMDRQSPVDHRLVTAALLGTSLTLRQNKIIDKSSEL